MNDKSESTRQETLLRIEDKVTALWGSVCSADFLFQNTVIEEGKANGDDRFIIDLPSADFDAVIYAMRALAREAKEFKEFFYREWEEGAGPPSV
jgi:hypothetical protein